jgi:Putative auto-transporter adhesin, head GIN domain
MYLKMIKTQITDNHNIKKMKTKISAIITMFVVALGITNLTYAAPVNSAAVTVLTDIKSINKIEIRGNVELFISDGATDQVKVYNKYYSESALVQSSNGVLRITSYNAEKLVVWVTANDLSSVSAYDNAEVSSFGDLSKIEFNVDLHNNASAKLNLEAYSANLTVSDQAKANLSGSADEYTLKYSNAANVDQTGFVAGNTSKTLTTVAAKKPVATDFDDLANL